MEILLYCFLWFLCALINVCWILRINPKHIEYSDEISMAWWLFFCIFFAPIFFLCLVGGDVVLRAFSYHFELISWPFIWLAAKLLKYRK